MRIWILVGLLLAAGPARAAIDPGEPFTLRIGDAREVGEAGLVVEFEEIVHDSRCPRLVVCVWEGVAELHVRVEAPPSPPQLLLLATETSQPQFYPTDARYEQYVVRLVELAPYPISPGSVHPSLYMATLVVEEGTIGLDGTGWSTLKSRYRD